MNRSAPQACTFSYGGVIYPYELYVGGVKRLNLRIRPDGSIRVSVPARCGKETLELFLLRCAPRIAKSLEHRKAKSAKGSLPLDKVRYLGGFLPVTVVSVAAGPTICHADHGTAPTRLTVLAPKSATQADISAAIDTWAKDTLLNFLKACHLRVVLPAFAPLPLTARQRELVTTPTCFRIRAMKSRWGSCNTQTGAMTYNLALLGYPLKAMEYVVMHEFAHLVHPNHSPAYHALMDRLLPDWRTRRDLLK